jgi:CheY-like chemotaxis protein
MDSTTSAPPGPSILVVEDDAELRALIACALKQAGHEAVLASSGEDALDLIAAADVDGLYCDIELPDRINGWEVGTTFSFIWPSKPTVYASAATTEPPGRLRIGIFLRKPLAMDRLVQVFEAGAIAARARRQRR